VQAPEALRRNIQRKIARQRSAENLRRYASYSAVAAGLAVIATAGYVAKGDGPTAPRPLEVVMDAVDKHARALPVEVTPAAGDVDSWFRGKVDFAVRAPVFNSPLAPRLMGARLANVRDRQAAYFVYGGDDPGRRVTLLLFPGSDLDLPGGSGEAEVMVANEKGYNVAMWRKQGIVYSLVSDLDERDILQLVSQVEER
jgi:anti-sigma factor RsiW